MSAGLFTNQVRRYVGLGLILGVAVLMAAFELRHIQQMGTTLGTTVFALLPFLINMGLIGGVVVLWRSSYDGDDILRIAAWVILGMIMLALMVRWNIAHQNIRGSPFGHAQFVTVNNLSAGALVGFFLGWYNVQSRRHQQDVEEERAKLAFLYRTLRHNLLNGLNIMIGNAEVLRDEVDESAQPHLNKIRSRGEELDRFVNAINTLMDDFSGSPTADFYQMNLSDVLAAEVDKAREDFGHADFQLAIPDEMPVMADDLIPELFNNLLSNAVEHNDKQFPAVAISAGLEDGEIHVSIADNGPGIPDDEQDRMLEWNTKGADSGGTGLGLAIADTLATRYGGTIWIEDNEPTGTKVTVELPKAIVTEDGDG